MNDTLSWVACGLLLPAIYLIGRKHTSGFVLGVVANILWIVWAWRVRAWAVAVETLAIIAMYIKALVMWHTQARDIKREGHINNPGMSSVKLTEEQARAFLDTPWKGERPR